MTEAELFRRLTGTEGSGQVLLRSPGMVAFPSPEPAAPFHALVVALPAADGWPEGEFWGSLLRVVEMAGAGARWIGDGPGSGLPFHVHVLGGRPFGWPPG